MCLLLLCVTICSTGCASDTGEESPASDNSDQTSQEVSKQSPLPPVTLNLVAVGDDLIHGPIYREAKAASGGDGYDFSAVYTLLAPYVSRSDLAFVNQETPLGGAALGVSSYPMFNSPQEVGDQLYDMGFNLISHANNHILDKGSEGMDATLRFWLGKKDIALAGVAMDEKAAADTPTLEVKGVKVALLAYTYGTNGLFLPEGSSLQISYIDKEKIKEQVLQAKETADIVLVSMHWGNEYQMTPSQEQKDLAKYLADLGVDVVIGTHPHVIQTMEILERPDGGKTLVFYSLGNLVSAQNKSAAMLGGMGRAQLIFDPEQKTVTLGEISFVPLVTQYGTEYSNVRVIPWDSYSEELASEHGIRAKNSNFSYAYLKKLITDTIPPEFLHWTDE